jgi:NAD-dependent deacetylase
MKKKLIVLTGAGISAESGIKTFRDSDGLWENHRIEEVATPEAWTKNPELVLYFLQPAQSTASLCSTQSGPFRTGRSGKGFRRGDHHSKCG